MSAFLLSRGEVQARYAVRLLADARPTASGLLHRTSAGEACVPWSDVVYALAAEVGEPQGLRAIVFDLVLGRREGAWQVVRFHEEPGADAESVAQRLSEALPGHTLGAAVKSLATESVIGEWHPDLPSFDEAALGLLGSRTR